MAITAVPIPAATDQTTYLSVGDSAVTFMSLCNHSAAPVDVNVYIVPNGSLVSTNTIMLALTIPAGETYIIYQGGEKLIFANGDKIAVNATIGGVVTTITSYLAV